MRRPTTLRQYLILGFSLPVFALNLWILGQLFAYLEYIINLLITAAILAFLLNYLVQVFVRLRLPRTQAILLVILLTLTLLVVTGVVLVPIVIDQATQLLRGIPTLLESGSQNLSWLDRIVAERRLPIKIDQLSEQIAARTQELLVILPGVAIGTLGRLLDMLLILVLTCYMLFYGDRLWQGLINLLPMPLGPVLGRSVQHNFQRFFIVQFFMSLFMFVTTVSVFLFLKVNFALLFAFIIGLSQLVPVVGATLGIGAVTLLVMLQSFGNAVWVAIAAIFLQQIKDNLLAPKLLGDIIGINPLWQFIALLIGARIAGLLGVILSIPVAATIKATFEELRKIAQVTNIPSQVMGAPEPYDPEY